MFGKGTCKQKEIDNECVVACLGQCVKRESCASVENLRARTGGAFGLTVLFVFVVLM